MRLLADALTISRMILAYGLVVCVFSEIDLLRFCALPVFLLASLTDYWDGRLARQSGGGTAFGAFMDPVADKVLTLSAFLSFWAIHILPLTWVLVVVFRDVAVTVMRLFRVRQGKSVQALPGGKQKTVFQMVYISLVLLYVALRETAVWSQTWEAPAMVLVRGGMILIILMTILSGYQAWSHRRPATPSAG